MTVNLRPRSSNEFVNNCNVSATGLKERSLGSDALLANDRHKLSIRHQQVTTDGHDSYPRAIREILGPNVKHRCSAFMNRRIERDHRGVKQRYYPMLGFGALPSAQRFWRAFEEVRQSDRAGSKTMSSHSARPDNSFCSEQSSWKHFSPQHN
jgi:hypothetical protein